MVDVDYIPFDTSDMYEFKCLACNCIFAIHHFFERVDREFVNKKPKTCPGCGKAFTSEDDYERQVGDE